MCLGHADRVDLREALRSENAYEAVVIYWIMLWTLSLNAIVLK